MSEESVKEPQEKNELQRKSLDRYFSFLYAVIWPFFNLFRPIRAVGRENIPKGPAVICPNHTTAGDPFYGRLCFWT